MKKISPIIILLIASVFLFSCEKEVKADFISSPLNLDAPIQNSRGGDTCCHEENAFERQLHWFSFIAAEITAKNSSVTSELALYISNNPGDNINADQLIGDSAVLPLFSAAFYNTLIDYLSRAKGYPVESGTEPDDPILIGGWPANSDAIFQAGLYYDLILEGNCVELYFPVGHDFSVGFTVTSSSHPLTTSESNEGFEWEYNGLSQDWESSGIVLNQAYANTHDNIMVARPYRNATEECLYTEYNGIDFEDFMD